MFVYFTNKAGNRQTIDLSVDEGVTRNTYLISRYRSFVAEKCYHIWHCLKHKTNDKMSECNKRCTASYTNAGANAILWRSAVTAVCHSAATTPHSSSNFTTRGALQTSANIMPGFYDANFIASARTEAVTKKQSRSISKIKKHLWTCVLHPVLYFVQIPALRLTDGSRNTFARWLGIIKHGVTGGETRKKKYWPRLKTNDINDTRVLFHGQWKMRRKIILAAEGIVERARQFWDARWKAWINFAWRTLPLVPHLGKKKGWTRLRAASYSVTMRALHHSRRPVNTTYWSSNIWLSMLLD